jgi:hypothetical protein
MKKHWIAAVLAALPLHCVFACASDGCSLGSDIDAEALSSNVGLRLDLRYDFLNQNRIRHGSGPATDFPLAGHEQELFTRTGSVTAGIYYRWNAYWSVNAQIPILHRTHATNGFAFDGTDAGSSNATGLGDVKVIGSYMGLSDSHDLGIQFGVKLPTGRFTQAFDGGPLAGQPLDRGLQLGTGTTDAIAGVFRFAPLSQNWSYFAQGLAQVALNERAGFRPGKAANINLGLRYLGWDALVPQLQVNAKILGRDAGVNASPDDSGGRTLYLSPGFTASLTEKLKISSFVQIPVYQDLNGYQLAPKSILSVAARYEF